MILINLFFAFLRIGLFAIGGAYAFLPIIEKEVVEKYNWLTKEEFLNVLGASQVLPGAISIKYATYTGYKMAGIPGAIVANLSNILPPALFMIFASALYLRYRDIPILKGAFNTIRLAIFAMIIAMAFQSVDIYNLVQPKNFLIIVLSFVVFFYTKAHPAIIIIFAGILGTFWK